LHFTLGAFIGNFCQPFRLCFFESGDVYLFRGRIAFFCGNLFRAAASAPLSGTAAASGAERKSTSLCGALAAPPPELLQLHHRPLLHRRQHHLRHLRPLQVPQVENGREPKNLKRFNITLLRFLPLLIRQLRLQLVCFVLSRLLLLRSQLHRVSLNSIHRQRL